MNELPSTEFRKRFARLTEPTVVTVNGHPIGTWEPRERGPSREQVAEIFALTPRTAQTKRDDLLRQINKKENKR